MKLRTCEYCGTEYDEALGRCPLCGKTAEEAVDQEFDFLKDVWEEEQPAPAPVVPKAAPNRRLSGGSGGARVASRGGKKKADRAAKREESPRWVWGLVCGLLGLAVTAGILCFLFVMGAFNTTGQTTVIPPTESDDLPEYNYENQLPANDETQEETESQVTTDPSVVACTGLTLSMNSVSMDTPGVRIFLTAVAIPSDCTQEIEFISNDETVVTVDQNGLITAVGPGQADILAICGDVVEVCTVFCEFEEQQPELTEPDDTTETDDPAEPDDTTEPDDTAEPKPDEEIALSAEDFTLFHPGEETLLTVKNAPAGAVITYSSSDTKVVTVSSTGTVKAVGNGTATITVTVNSTVLTCVARCNLGASAEDNTGASGNYTGPFTIANEYGTLQYNDVTLGTGESCTFRLVDANGETVTGINWTGGSGAFTVSGGGKVTAVGTGVATVSAVYGGQTYTVTVRCGS